MNAMIKRFFCCAVALSGIAMLGAVNYTPESVSATLALKVPGNSAEVHALKMQRLVGNYFITSWLERRNCR